MQLQRRQRAGGRPARRDLDPTALALLERHGAQILATARRYAATPEDAEDAYQRAFEILLTKAPSTSEDELVPWLKTVVKHEAFALRRQRERHSPVTDDGRLGDRPTPPAITHDQAEQYERLRQGAEALRHLKPQEIRALRLKAEGYSYREICEITGWTYTKVNRCLTEGRQAFARRLAGIQGGVECERFAPLLSALADGEASAEQLALLRPHMRTCLACRARLKAFRAAPAQVAALVPPAALVFTGAGPLGAWLESALGGAQQKLEAVVGATQQKAATFGERAHTLAELAAGQKVAAVAASAVAVAGGGTAVEQLANHRGPPRAQLEQREPARRAKAKPVKEEVPVALAQALAPEPDPAPQQPAEAAPDPDAAPAPAPTAAPPAPPPAQPAPPPPPPDPANEFTPGVAPSVAAPTTPAPAPTQPAPSGTGPAAAGGGSAAAGAPGGGSSGPGEFAP
jgi:RNA polymerase sigma factor (sigma-70 family)